jgi:hypothetical protein
VNKSQFSNLNTVVRGEDFKFSQFHQRSRIEELQPLSPSKISHSKNLTGEKLTGWGESSRKRPCFNDRKLPENSASPLKPRPQLNVSDFLNKGASIYGTMGKTHERSRAIQTPTLKDARKKGQQTQTTKDLPSIIIHEKWFD